MEEKQKMRIEKEEFEIGYQEYLNELGKSFPEKTINRSDRLTWESVGDRKYRVVNKETGRFHNIELGIDWVV